MSLVFKKWKLLLSVSLITCILLTIQAFKNQPRYVLIDGGAFFGESILKFRATPIYKKHSWDIYAIEANPNLEEVLSSIKDVTVISKAISNKNGKAKFYWFGDYSGNNSLLQHNKANLDATEINTFDFSQWIKRNFSPSDYILLSLDIEGAEYRVLDKMRKDGTLKYIDRIYIEFHAKFEDLDYGKDITDQSYWTKIISESGSTLFPDSIEDIMEKKKDSYFFENS